MPCSRMTRKKGRGNSSVASKKAKVEKEPKKSKSGESCDEVPDEKPKTEVEAPEQEVKSEKVEEEIDEIDEDVIPKEEKPKRGRGARQAPKKSTVASKAKKEPVKIEEEKGASSKTPQKDSASKDGWEPENWRQQVDNIYELRKKMPAPIDEMPWYKAQDPAKASSTERFEMLVALMLSSQTRDEKTTETLNSLKEKGLSVDMIADADETELAEWIRNCNFRVSKAKNLIKVAKTLRDDYDSDIPDTFEGLTNLPGVGPKMAYLALQAAWNKVEGIGVDTNILRVAQRLKWQKKLINCAERTRIQIQGWLPRDEWFKFNRDVTGFGQIICTPKSPKCSECLNNKICPVAFKVK